MKENCYWNRLQRITLFRTCTLAAALFGCLLLTAFPNGFSREAHASGDRPLVGVINYSGLTGQNKTWDEVSLTPPEFHHRLPFYAVRENDDSRVARSSNTPQEIVYHADADITNFRLYAAFDDSKTYDIHQDIRIYSSSDGSTYTEAPAPGLSGKSVHEITGADNWQKVNYTAAFEPGVRYVKVVIAKTDDGPLNPQIMRAELYYRNATLTNLVRVVDDFDDLSKLHSHSPGIALASHDPEKFTLVAADDNEESIVNQQIAYANSAGIDYIAYLDMPVHWYGHTPRVFDLFRQNPNKGDLKYAVILGAPASDGETWPEKIDRLLEYFADSFYVRVDGGRPLLYLISLENWTKSQIDALRAASVDASLGDPYVVGMTASSGYSSFLDSGGEYASVEAGVVKHFAGTSHTVPLVSLGVNDEPRHSNPPPWGAWGPDEPPVTTTQLKNLLTEALDWTASNPSLNPADTVLIYAWNEHAEAASNIEPTLNPDGTANTALLDAVGEVLDDYEPPGGGNLLTNGDFENGLTGWSAQASSIASESGAVHAGSGAVYVSSRTDPWGSPVQDIKDILLANGQGDYEGSAWVKYASGSDWTVIMINLTDDSGSRWFAMGYTNVGTSYAQISGGTTVTWTGTLHSATIYIQGGSSTADMYVDDFILNKL